MNAMTELNHNYIAGAWVAGDGEIENQLSAAAAASSLPGTGALTGACRP